LTIKVYPCDFKDIPANGSLDGYKNVTKSTCTYCSTLCEPPNVNGDIGFFDGCNWTLVGIAVGVTALITVLW
jgi:hypothetical protein